MHLYLFSFFFCFFFPRDLIKCTIQQKNRNLNLYDGLDALIILLLDH